MQDIFRNNPFIRLFIPFLAGIVLGLYWISLPETFLLYIFICLIGLYIFVTLIGTRNLGWLKNTTIVTLFLILGLIRSEQQQTSPTVFSDKKVFSARLIDYPDSTANSIKLKLTLKAQISDTGQSPMKGKAFVYLPKDSASLALEAGDQLVMNAEPELIENQGNPEAFDFKAWAASQGFVYQFYASTDNWQKVDHNPNFELSIFLKKLRRSILNYYAESGISSEQLAVFSALTLGDKSMLEHDLRQGYAAAGLMHILAVSGLHVGIIYIVITQLLKPLSGKKWGRLLRFFLSVIILWGYAMFTGLSPSVTRAATMFSVFVAGDLLGRRYAVFNSIALAAFVLLFYNPFMITSVGFQMSFLAVIGIVGFYPIIYRWFYVPWKPLDKIWQLMAVSIAAQIITTPLSLYYFNQFPLLFLLSNLLMVPLATLLMYLFVLLIVFIPFPKISYMLGQVVEFIASIMNTFSQWVGNMEWSTLQGIYIDDIQLILFYLLIGSITYWGFHTNFRNLKLVFTSLLVFISTTVGQQYQRSSQNAFIVFNTFEAPVIMQISGQNYETFCPDSTTNTQWFTQPLITKYGLKQQKPVSSHALAGNKLKVIRNRNRVAIFYNMDFYPQTTFIGCDWLILSENSPYDLKKLLEKIPAQSVIIDPSVSQFKVKKWVEQFHEQAINLHQVSREGAFVEFW